MAEKNRQIFVVKLPKGQLDETTFESRESAAPEPGDGEALVRTIYLSLDAANRAWMQGATYKAPVLEGEVMHGGCIGRVVKSNAPGLREGDIVECMSGWQEYSLQRPQTAMKLEPKGPLTHYMSVLGVTGLTAYFGLLEVGRPKQGDVLVVSAAAGAVGNVVGQISKIKGCRVVGIAGSDPKCEWLKNDLGFDETINYKSQNVAVKLRRLCPDGIDVYFDNTGGDILEACLFQMKMHGRIACCGVVSQYDTATPAAGPRGVPGLLVVKRLRMEGFIVMDYYSKREQAITEIAGWIKQA